MEVEQELISEGLPETDVLKLCDIHGEVLDGHVEQSGIVKWIVLIIHPLFHQMVAYKVYRTLLLNSLETSKLFQ